MSLITIISTFSIGPKPNGVTASLSFSTTTSTLPATSTSSSSSSSSTSTSSSSSSSQTPNFGSANTNTPTLPPGATTSATGSGIVADGTSSPSTSATEATAGQATGGASSTTGSSTNTGLIAGIAVVGALLLIALAALIFLLLRRRRSNRSRAGANIDNEVTELEDRGNKGRHNITSHEIEQSLLANSGFGAATPLDDKQVNAKFSKLNQDIKDWVLTHFRNMNPRTRSPNQDVLRAIQTQPNYKTLLQDSRGKYLVIRGVVADGLTDAFDNGEINGFADVFGMKERFPTNVGAKEKAQWRSSTVALLAKDSGFRDRQERAVDTIADRIDYVSSSLAGLEHSDTRLRQLTSLVESAAGLALELSKQRMNFVILHPDGTTFDPNTMEDVLQESRGEELQDHKVLSVVFPAIVRYGDESGEGFDRRNIISKALVFASDEENTF